MIQKSIWALLLFFLLLPLNTPALTLYGVNLEQASAAQLRLAIKQAGAKIVSEGGADKWFDQYKSEKLLDGSQVIYLGFSKGNQAFAFLEYEIKPAYKQKMLEKLFYKYGQPQVTDGRFISDSQYRWIKDNIHILWYYDFFAHTYRLIYSKPDTLQQLKTSRDQWLAKQRNKQLAEQGYAY